MSSEGGNVFRSWKAIANYFDKSERTVRRWESQEGLPVHRHQHQSAARIFAYQNELDAWFLSRAEQNQNLPNQTEKTLCMALLPFDKFIDDPASAFIADALCEDIVADLSCLPGVTMISFSSSRQLTQSNEDPVRALTPLSVHYYIEGSFRLSGNTSRIQVRLIELSTQRVVWSARYEEAGANWQRSQQVIVAELINSLPLSAVSGSLAQSGVARFNNNVAWEYLHKARTESLKWQSATIERAISLLTSADKLVGGSALIQANLGRVHLQLREAGLDCSDVPIAKVVNILREVSGSHPNALFTLSLQAWLFYIRGEISSAVNTLKQVLQINPNEPDALALIANCYLLAGQPALAKPFIDTLQIVDPLTPLSRCMPGYYSLMSGHHSEAVRPYKEMLLLDPSNAFARLFLVWVLAINHDTKQIEQVCEDFGANQENALIMKLASAFRFTVQKQAFTLELNQNERECAEVNGMLARFTAFAFAATGERDKAIHWLAVAIELGFFPYTYMAQHDRFFRPWHHHEAMQALLEEMKTRWLAFAAQN